MTFYPELVSSVRRIGRREFDFARQIAVMAIVNRTPNSFFDNGRTYDLGRALEGVERAVEHGADWVDVGGLAFSHEQSELSVADEVARVVPVIAEVRERTDVVLSVDTHRAEVAKAALAAGADVVNDTFGLRDPHMAEVIADAGAHVVITHSIGGPRTRVPRPTYSDVVREVADFLRDRVAHALASGIQADRIIIDPGHDLNKNTYHTLELTRRLDEIAEIGYPTLVAVSNKDFIGETLDAPKDQRLTGTIAINAFCVSQGARILRVHDVREAVEVARMMESVLGWRDLVQPRHNLV